MNEDSLLIREHKSAIIPSLSEEDIDYLRKDCFKSTSHSHPPYEVDELKGNEVRIKNTSYSGIIQLQDLRLYFSTKVKTNLFYMLSFLRDEKSFCYDPEKPIEIKEGANFFDVLGRMFLNELEEIFEKGFYKSYIRKDESIAFVKGKLVIKGQLQNDLNRQPKFSCSYEDLTYDNLENRIILRATTLLIPLIKFNEEIKRDLIKYSYMLREEVNLVNIIPDDCDKVQFDRLNEYYETIIRFSKVILQNYFIRSTSHGETIGFNFIVNMNKVYEDFITTILEELIEEDKIFSGYELEKQKVFDTLVKERKIVTKPDVILKRKNSKEYPIIIDAKYKPRPANADYYQIIAYCLALRSAESCYLVLPEAGQREGQQIESEDERFDRVLTLVTNPADAEARQVKLHAVTIDLKLDTELSFNEYILAIREELKNKLKHV